MEVAITNFLIDPNSLTNPIAPYILNEIYFEANLEHFYPKVDMYLENVQYIENESILPLLD